MIRKILCFFGFHKWVNFSGNWPVRIIPRYPDVRKCKFCGLRQRLEFYSNRTQAWVDMEDWED